MTSLDSGMEINDLNRESYGRAMAFDPTKESLYMFGSCGVGKTEIARRLYVKWEDRLKVPIYGNNGGQSIFIGYDMHSTLTNWHDFKLLVKECARDTIQERSMIRLYGTSKLFFMDDLGSGHENEWANSILIEILDKRALNKINGLILTSNLSLSQLSEKQHDDRMASRLAGLCDVIHMLGEDFRLKSKVDENAKI